MLTEDDLVDNLLFAAHKELELAAAAKQPRLTETNLFNHESNTENKDNFASKSKTNNKKLTDIHTGLTDSSDDEENRCYEDRKYNESGRNLKHLLGSSSTSTSSLPSTSFSQKTSTWKSQLKLNDRPTAQVNVPITTPEKPRFKEKNKTFDVYTDPIFGLRIVNPLISSATLQERMQEREAVPFARISRYIQVHGKEKDWVIAGVIVNKSAVKTSQKGSQFSIWTLSDLKDDIKTITLFLFSGAHKKLWKTIAGTVIGILNPNILDKKDNSKDEASLSVDNHQKVMIFGQSKDFGTCKSLRKNGEPCTAIVNLSRCEYCLYHIKQEYQKCSKRSELQANYAGRGLTALRNKVLGKNEVFYAGKSYTSIPARKNKKLEKRDEGRLQRLSGLGVSPAIVGKAKDALSKRKMNANRLDISQAQRLKDIEMLKRLGGTSNLETKVSFSGEHSLGISLEESKTHAISVINKLKEKKTDLLQNNKPIKKGSQFDLKADLIVNVDNKKTFDNKVSNAVTLDESKSTALNVIAKLKSQKEPANNSVTEKTKDTAFLSNEVFSMDGDFNLSYGDEVEISTKSKEILDKSPQATTPKSSPLSKNHNNTNTNSTPKSLQLNNLKNSLQPTTPKSSPSCKNQNNTSNSTPESIQSKNCFQATTPKSSPLNKNQNNSLNSTPKSIQSNNLKNCSQTTIPKSSPHIKNQENFTNSASEHIQSNNLKQNVNLGDKPVAMNVPCLSGFNNKSIDLSRPVTPRHVNRAKLNALKYIQKAGPLKKVDPNSTKGSGTKRSIEIDESTHTAKKSKLAESEFISDRFKKMMAKTSKHMDLLEDRDNEEQEKYFNKLELKERMEEKMTNTFKVACKAVRCLQCKYTSFSASDLCKTERHPLKVFDAMKRFFKCGNCGNRTVSLDIVPTAGCKNCGSGKWERTGMMKEKQAQVAHSLSIRGGEQGFVNAVATNSNINLLVPDD